jgi:hypothetical protein
VGIVTLKPDAEDVTLALYTTPYWTLGGGAGTAVGALSDGSSGTYLQADTFFELDDRPYSLNATTLGTNQRVTAIRLKASMLKYDAHFPQRPGLFTLWVYAGQVPSSHPADLTGTSGAGGGGHWYPGQGTAIGPRLETVADAAVWGNDGTAPYGGNAIYPAWQRTTGQMNIPATYDSGWWAATDTGSFWTQAMLNDMAVLITMRSSQGVFQGGYATVQWAEIAVEVDVRTQPTVVVNQGVGNPIGASVTWTTTANDGDTQSAWEAKLFTQAQTTTPGFSPDTSTPITRAKGVGGAQGVGFAAGNLTAGATYVAYVRAAKKMGVDTNGLFPAGSRSYDWYSQWASNTVFISPVDTATYTPQLPNEGKLGCHQWAVTGGVRGGTAIRTEIPYTAFRWGRTLQDVSQAEVTFPRAMCDLDPFLADLRPWEHELAFWRDSPDSASPVLEWVGPITGRRVTRDTMTLRARDWFTIFEHRKIHGDYTLSGVELATLYAAIALDALGPDRSSGIQIVIHATGTTADRQILATEYRRAADVLRELGRAGVDWTIVGRYLLAGGVELGVMPCRLLLDEHVAQITGDENGESAATDVTVVGGRTTTSDTAVAGVALSGDARGVLESVIQSSDIEDDVSALSYATGMLALLSGGVPRSYDLTLEPDAQTPFGRMIPGARWPVDIPTMGLLETLRLHELDVQIQRTPDGQTQETVNVKLTSLGQLGF